eukprot:CAMPEP_0117795248 /NCGR_PEP_ID=MMETSP0948-20121206/11185_1 /TAXON_ID=44440 /ORGANISM="Chattonella subsalsa, Strain CCMP2191" /LENGTH=746 /DNA_ID=CAMNT_0005626147 /DNA_START=15 /DNA_END=2255 /DNA_ORIENTATION=-
MAKLLRLYKLYETMSQWEELDTSHLTLLARLSKFLMIVFLMSHISACVLMGITQLYRLDDGQLEDFESHEWNPDSWIMRAGLDGFGRGRTYLLTLYWAFTTLTTVGYGDITAYLPGEIAWTVFVMICGTSLFGYIIGNVASVMTHVDETAVLIKNKIQSVTAYMRYRQFPPTIVNKIRRHYEYSWKRTQVYNEEEILSELPTTVRTEVALYIHQQTIMKVPFLRDLGEDVVPMLVHKLKPILASPRDVIIKEDYFGEEMYFVVGGELKMFLDGGKVQALKHKRRERSFAELVLGEFSFFKNSFMEMDVNEEITREMEIHVGQINKGDYFAEYAIILDFAKHPVSVKALGYCDIFSMSKAGFLDISEHFPDVFNQVISVGIKRYKLLMETLGRKRTWATAALVRGVKLEKIEGEDIQQMVDTEGSALDRPLGFLERWNRRRDLELLMFKREEEHKKMKVTTDLNNSAPHALIKDQESRDDEDKYGFQEEDKESEVFPISPKSPALDSSAKRRFLDIGRKSGTKIHADDQNNERTKGERGSSAPHPFRDTLHDVKEKLVHGAHESMCLKTTLSSKMHYRKDRASDLDQNDKTPSLLDYAQQATAIEHESELHGRKISFRMLAKIKHWKNRAVMNVALNNMTTVEKHHRRKVKGKMQGRNSVVEKSSGNNIDRPSHNTGTSPMAEKMARLSESQKMIESRMESMEDMMAELHTTAEKTNENLAHLARLLGQQQVLDINNNGALTPHDAT